MLYPYDVPAILNASSELSPNSIHLMILGIETTIPFNNKEVTGYQDLQVLEVIHWGGVEPGSHSGSVCLQTPHPPHYGKLPL